MGRGARSALFRTTIALGVGFALVGVLAVVVTLTPLVHWWATKLAGPWHDPKGEILIVLTGSTLDTGVMGHSSFWRSAYALLIYREGGVQRIVVTGGSDGPVPVAEMIRTFLIAGGVPAERIQTEIASRTTWQSAQEVSRLLSDEPGTKVLMTSDLHMFRAYRMFRNAGLDVLPRPVPDARKHAAQWHLRWGVFLSLVRETAAIVYHGMKGRL